MIEKKILHYKVIEKLGEGGMGVVYLAEDSKLERRVAIKFLPHHITANSDERKRFEIEAKAAAALNHPNIATIHAIEESDTEMFLVMEYIEGKELRNIVRAYCDTPQPINKTIDYAIQIAGGLQAAHEKGIVHRDIKSSNIMVTEDGKVKIMDFGLAKFHGSAQLTQIGTTLGTAAYMSPEQARGDEVDHRSDIWSFGVVLYEMLTGELPFKGEYEQAVIYNILNESPESMTEHSADITEELVHIMDKCLQKEPSNRYQNAEEIIRDLSGKYEQSKSIKISTKKNENAQNKKRGNYYIAAIAGFLIIVFGGYLFFTQKAEDNLTVKDKLIVLPFENLGPSEEEYFAEGITEEITSRLSSLKSLAVISRKSARQYRETEKTIKQIGEELGVKYILEGTVRWARNPDGTDRVRITPQLIQTKQDVNIWTHIYEETIEDIFRVQSEIAHNVVKELGITLEASEVQNLNKTPTENIEAYQSYIRGIYYLNRPHFTRELWLKAVESFEHAVKLDPHFALAYAALSKTHSRMIFVRYDLTPERMTKADSAASKALRFGRDLPEIHLNIGYYYLWAYRDSEMALKEFRIAEQGMPNNADVQRALSSLYSTLGQWDIYMKALKKGIELSPRDPSLVSELAFAYWFNHEFDLGLEASNKAIEISPGSNWPYYYKANIIWSKSGPDDISQAALENASPEHSWWLWYWYWQETMRGNYQKALDLLSKREGMWMNNKICARPNALLAAFIYDFQNKKELAQASYDSARVLLEQAVKETPDDPRYHSSLGIAYAGLGNKVDAIKEGKKAVELLPLSKDAIYGTIFVTDLAHIYTLVGEFDLALKQLEELLIKPSMLSSTWLKNDIRFARMHDKTGFQELTKKYSEKN
ncbi:MAG: hypothetical protein D8M58_00640 [Calditrichaeota bacterium]|nr:MAG: hypothetical protein DWQ03_06440 [Calditrichota bacterium]MBL1203877.1 hypothetical protein [Calditrichota bacterium]NOG43709.1 protein kinase [Calditrichota bacterium]